MSVQSPHPISTSQVNRAGRVLRGYLRSRLDLSDPRVRKAIDVVEMFRAAHQYPLIKANMGLRSVVRTEHCEIEVSQRLKRFRTIVDKLDREPTMQLANMQDIGGCRAVLRSMEEISRVRHRLSRNRPPLRVADYALSPRISGYRAVHIVVR